MRRQSGDVKESKKREHEMMRLSRAVAVDLAQALALAGDEERVLPSTVWAMTTWVPSSSSKKTGMEDRSREREGREVVGSRSSRGSEARERGIWMMTDEDVMMTIYCPMAMSVRASD